MSHRVFFKSLALNLLFSALTLSVSFAVDSPGTDCSTFGQVLAADDNIFDQLRSLDLSVKNPKLEVVRLGEGGEGTVYLARINGAKPRIFKKYHNLSLNGKSIRNAVETHNWFREQLRNTPLKIPAMKHTRYSLASTSHESEMNLVELEHVSGKVMAAAIVDAKSTAEKDEILRRCNEVLKEVDRSLIGNKFYGGLWYIHKTTNVWTQNPVGWLPEDILPVLKFNKKIDGANANLYIDPLNMLIEDGTGNHVMFDVW